jgi:hypothetical protein
MHHASRITTAGNGASRLAAVNWSMLLADRSRAVREPGFAADSIALDLVRRLNAERLVVVKSCRVESAFTSSTLLRCPMGVRRQSIAQGSGRQQ